MVEEQSWEQARDFADSAVLISSDVADKERNARRGSLYGSSFGMIAADVLDESREVPRFASPANAY